MGIRRWLRGTFRADRFEADEVDAGSVNTESASVNGPLDAETATVDQANVADGLVFGEEIDSDTTEDSGAVSATVTIDIDSYTHVIFDIATAYDQGAELTLTVDGDTGSNYNYMQLDNTMQKAQNEILIAGTDGTSRQNMICHLEMRKERAQDVLVFPRINVGTGNIDDNQTDPAVSAGYDQTTSGDVDFEFTIDEMFETNEISVVAWGAER